MTRKSKNLSKLKRKDTRIRNTILVILILTLVSVIWISSTNWFIDLGVSYYDLNEFLPSNASNVDTFTEHGWSNAPFYVSFIMPTNEINAYFESLCTRHYSGLHSEYTVWHNQHLPNTSLEWWFDGEEPIELAGVCLTDYSDNIYFFVNEIGEMSEIYLTGIQH